MDDLVSVLSKDMGIIPYPGESSQYYKCRLIYSAVCEWMRYATQDSMGKKSHSRSKHYILSRCSEVLNAFLECEPTCRVWFLDENAEDDSVSNAIRCIREKMICAGELVEVGVNKHVTVPEYQEIDCTLGYTRIFGFNRKKDAISMVGITRIKQNLEEKNAFFEGNHYDIEEFINWTYEKGEWSICDSIDRFEFFDITSKRIPSESWIDKPIKTFERHLGRITLFNGYHEYWILKYQDGRWSSRALESILQDYKEERRILLGLRELYGNNMKAEFEYKAPIVILRLCCRLPLREEIVLDTFAWPLRGYNDKLYYVVPYKLWDTIKLFLTKDLGIVLKEKR